MAIPKPKEIKLTPAHLEILKATSTSGKNRFLMPRGAAIVKVAPEILRAALELIDARYLVLVDEGAAPDVSAGFDLSADTIWAVYLLTPRAAAALKAATAP